MKQQELDDQLIGGGRKFLSIEAMLHRAKRGEKKKSINFTARSAEENFFKVCAFRLPFVKEISFQSFSTVQ